MAKAILVPQRARLPDSKEYYRPSIEYTGKGNLLCYDRYGSRWFRCSESAIHEAIDFMVEEYEGGSWVNYNYLYMLIGIAESDFGEKYGWTPDPDWKVRIEFSIEYHTREDMRRYREQNADMAQYYKWIDEDFLVFEPKEWSQPMEGYLEV